MLRWGGGGRPKAAEGGEVGCGTWGRAGARGGEGGGSFAKRS